VQAPGTRTARVVRVRACVIACLALLAMLVAGCGGSTLAPRYAVRADAAVQGQLARTTSVVVPGGQSGGTAVPAPGTIATPPPGSDPSTGLVPTAVTTTPIPTPSGVGTSAAHPAAVSCAGFRDQTGVTDSTVTIANVSDLSGPVPGIFVSAQQAVRAFVAYFNATSSLCGRKLSLLAIDSRTDPVGDQTGYQTACVQSFAAVGSMAAFDAGGARTAQNCGLPDLRSQSVSDERNACTTCFGAQATQLHAFQNAVPDFFLVHDHAATQKAAMLYVDEAASVDNAKYTERAEEMRGWHFVYAGAFDVAAFNYGPYIQQLKSTGSRLVQFVGSPDQAVRMAQAMHDVSYRPDVYLLDPTAYTPAYAGAGPEVEGTYVALNFTPFEEAAGNPELRLYEEWLQQVAPGATPTYFGVYAWSAARLFVEKAVALGGRFDRARLIAAVRTVHAWTSDGLHAPQDVGGKTNGNCWRFVRLHDGRWYPVGGTRYLCHGATIAP
jgi:ABC-type branched-subunit amino acid transport system substrate-binding protein